MAEGSEKKTTDSLDKTAEFFNVGAPLHAVRPGYVRRAADDLLFDTVRAGNYAHIIAPDRTGKTSLIASTSARLQNNGFKVAVLDLAQIAERDGGSDAGRWYYSIAYRLSRQLRLKTDLQTWWQDNSILSNRQRLVEFYVQVVLANIKERIVVFVDEIQYAAGLPFNEHLLASIRAAHNARVTEPEFNRLGFVLIGECDPHSLVSDPHLSPFSVSMEIRLADFTRQDLDVFAAELNLSPADAELALDRIFYWTSGQPYLSQKLARAVSREQIAADIEEQVDRLAMQQLAGRAALSSEPHLGHIHRAVVSDKKNHESLLTIYGQIRKGIRIVYDPESRHHRQLMAVGLLVANERGDLAVRNRIYETVFTARWANENLPLHWRGPAIAVLLVLAVTAIPFAYTQLLPKPYLRVMSNPTHDLETVSDAYANLRSFPGHTEAADRLYQSALENRARQATTRNEIREISRYISILPDGPRLAENLRADFWDRRVTAALQNEQRDEALLAALEALEVSTQERRRRAASLVGDDYSQLLATIPAQDADGLVVHAENMLLSWHRDAGISQWSMTEDGMQPRESWTISALEVSPLVRRVIVDREGVVNRIGLTVNVSHPRLDDLRMRLIAPSGRAAELTFEQASSAANEEIRISGEQLAPLAGESLTGTWSLSLRDEALGVLGHLMSWNLSLNSQVVVETFDRGLDIPDPVERGSEDLWFSDDGRYAIARALQSDSARLWDLNYAQAARTMAVPASELVLGVSANAEFLLTIARNSVNLWRTSDGRRHATLELGAAAAGVVLSGDGQHLLATHRGDEDTRFEVWSLATGEPVAELIVAGAPALIAIDASASHLAVADFDRAVRIWDFSAGELRSQFDLASQPSEIGLSANGDVLGVVHGALGVSLWRTDRPESPVLQDTGEGEWHIAFSPSGARFLAGNQREGMQVYRSADGMPSGPLLEPGLTPGGRKMFAFSADENYLVSAAVNDLARIWSVPPTSPGGSVESTTDPVPDAEVWRGSGNLVTAIAPGGERLASGDRSGHVHIERIDAGIGELTVDSEEVSFLGHRDAVVAMEFSPDASLVASVGADGTVRVWDAHSGLPRPFYGRASVSNVSRMVFSPSASTLAVLSGSRVWLMNTETGAELANVELGEVHADLAFATDDQLFLGGESGTLRNLYSDRTGNWHLRNTWQGPEAIHRMDISPVRQQILIVDAAMQAKLLDPRDGRVSVNALQLPDRVEDVAFSPNESRVLFKTGRWVHRAIVSPGGPIWTDAVRAPKALGGSGMVFGSQPNDGSAERVFVLARDTGLTELTELRFTYSEGPAMFGSKDDLLSEWTAKLRGRAASGFAREGF